MIQISRTTLSALLLTTVSFYLPSANAMGHAHTSGSPSGSTSSGSASTSPTPNVAPVADKGAPLALIYNGPGSCSVSEGDAGSEGYGCSQAAGDIAATAGFRVQYVSPTALSTASTAADVQTLFGEAKVWIQPGGVSVTASNAMSARLKTELKNFVANGGGYVGICAGAFLATSEIGTSGVAGLGIFPGKTIGYSYTPLKYDYALLSVNWDGTNRSIYFEGGPYLSVSGTNAEVMATFNKDNKVAAARASYQKGRVFLTGPHVEAPSAWLAEDGFTDPDGNEYQEGAKAILWAAGMSNN